MEEKQRLEMQEQKQEKLLIIILVSLFILGGIVYGIQRKL